MRLTTPPLANENINFKDHDALNREAFGVALLNLITRTNEELVICLDAPWGEGKTTFVNMWQNLLKDNQIKTIYFDAFANDYIDDAFIAITSHMVTFVANELQKNKRAKQKLEEFKKQAGKVGGQLLSWGVKVGIKAATLGVIKESDLEELSEIKNDIAKGTSNLASKFIEDRISSHKQEIETIITFKTTLEQFAKDINEQSDKPLVIIIDELDRCKPTYAVEIIEKIKHIFSVKNIVFLLVMISCNLKGQVKNVYGAEIDATTYLQKFINVNCVLPKNKDANFTNDYKKYCSKLFDQHDLEVFRDRTSLLDSISIIARHFDLSLRQLEKTFTNISIFYASVSENPHRLTPIISLLAITRVINHDLYAKLKNKTVTYTDFQKELGFPDSLSDRAEDRKMFRIIEWTQFCLFTDAEFDASSNKGDLERMDQGLWNYSLERNDIIPFYCSIFDMFTTN